MAKLEENDVERLQDAINTGNYEARAYARKRGFEDMYECSRENVIMMRVKTYLRSLTATQILHFMANVIAFVEELLAPREREDG